LGLSELDGIVLKLSEGIMGESIQVIVGEEIISVVVTGHPIESSLSN
jgi:hypothetical protein